MSNEAFELLRGVDLFSSLSDEQIKRISQLASERSYSKDQAVIIEDEDPRTGFFMIAEGECKVTLHSHDGKETILSLLSEGDFFGEMSLLDGEPRSATVRAVRKSRLMQISRIDFINQLKNYPDLCMELLSELSLRLRRANKQIGSLTMMSVSGRVAGTIINLAEEHGHRIRDEHGKLITVIRDLPTQQQLADMSGTTRETVSRILTMLKKKGIISIASRDLFILEEDALKPNEDS